MKNGILIFILVSLFVFLTLNILEMPSLGSKDNPSYNETASYYVQNTREDTNAANIITAIITDYRAFDTLGEITVLFASIAAVVSVLKGIETKKTVQRSDKNG